MLSLLLSYVLSWPILQTWTQIRLRENADLDFHIVFYNRSRILKKICALCNIFSGYRNGENQDRLFSSSYYVIFFSVTVNLVLVRTVKNNYFSLCTN